MTDNLLDDQSTDDKNYLELLVGEGKKFKTPEDLAKGKAHADQTVDILTKRLDEMREDYLKLREENMSRANVEELIDRLSNKQQNSNKDTPVNNQPAIDSKQIETLVSNKLLEIETTKKQQENLNIVKDKLREHFGDNYTSVIKQRSKELGLTEEDVETLARKSPTAFFKTLEVENKESFQAPPRSSQRTDNFAPKGAQKRTWSYYQELKKSDPKLYFDPKIAVQMQHDAFELGDAFNDGDFHRIGQ